MKEDEVVAKEMVKRIYVVDGKRLVRAQNTSQVFRFIANEHTVALASQDTLVELAGEGVKVEEVE